MSRSSMADLVAKVMEAKRTPADWSCVTEKLKIHSEHFKSYFTCARAANGSAEDGESWAQDAYTRSVLTGANKRDTNIKKHIVSENAKLMEAVHGELSDCIPNEGRANAVTKDDPEYIKNTLLVSGLSSKISVAWLAAARTQKTVKDHHT